MANRVAGETRLKLIWYLHECRFSTGTKLRSHIRSPTRCNSSAFYARSERGFHTISATGIPCFTHYGATAPKFCMFHKRSLLPLPSVERTKLRSCTVRSHESRNGAKASQSGAKATEPTGGHEELQLATRHSLLATL